MEIDIGFSDKIKFGFRYANYKINQSKLTVKDKTVIQTTYGPVQGLKRISPYGEQYHSFEGIPFAKPPIGKLRFRGPEEPEPWKEVLDCSEVKTKPVQHNLVLRIYEGAEDCLHLNVYSRNLRPEKPLPVLVWIYGGGFQVGEASRDLYAPDYLMKKEVVLIAINYRLGSLGFLSFDDPETKVSGNAALKDQVLALKWVKKNCAFFGGDPNNITVFGESAGAASTHYMMLTEQTRGLFHKGIVMSGSALAQWAVTPRRNWGFRMAQLLGYNGANNDMDVLHFLQTQKPYDVSKAGEKLLTVEERKSRIPFAFGPVIEPFIMEDSVITKAPIEMMKEAWSNKIPLMIGGVSFEGLLLSVEIKKYPFLLTDLDFRDLVPTDLNLHKESDKCKEMANKIQKYYFGDQKPSKENKNKYLELFSDKYWWHPIHRTIMSRLTHGSAPTYVYRFDFDSKTFNIFRRLTCGRKARGVCHADDIAYLFYNAIAKKLKETKREYKTIENMVTIWTNFATHGDPNSPDAQFNWSPSTIANKTENKCLNINDELDFIEIPELERINLWDSFYEREQLW